MVTQQLKEWGQRNGCRYIHNENDAFDVIEKRTDEGYAFGLSSEEDSNTTSTAHGLGGIVASLVASRFARKYIIRLAVDHNTWNKEYLKSLKKDLKGMATPAYIRGNLYFTMKKNAHTDETYNNMVSVITMSSKYLHSQGVKVPDSCIYCEQGNCDDYDTIKGSGALLQPAHSKCIKKNINESFEKLENRKNKEGYFPALLILIPGIIVGCIPAGIALLGSFYGTILNLIMYLLIPVIAVLFYRMVNGKAKWVVIPVTLILTGAAIAVMVVVGDYLWNVEEYTSFPWGDYLFIVWNNIDYLVEIIAEIIISWVPGLIGVIIAYISLWRKSKKNEKRLIVLREQVSRQVELENGNDAFPYI